MNNGGKSKRIADSTGGVLLCYSFLLNCLENGTIMWGGRIRQSVKETIGVGVNEKAALSSDKNCPFVYINFDFTLVNKVASL